MKAHLIKSGEVNPELFSKVMRLLQVVPGEIKFDCDENSSYTLLEEHFNVNNGIKKERIATWKKLFSKCKEYKSNNDKTTKEFCFLLTDILNESNYFAALDDSAPFNGFIHTGDWDLFIDCPPEFPIAYVVVSMILLRYINLNQEYDNFDFHYESKGCISDFCADKRNIVLKLRTADICKSCMNGLINNNLSRPVIAHARAIMEFLRVKMLEAQNVEQATEPSKLKVNEKFEIILEDFGGKKIDLPPLEKALYILFLKNPDGIYLSCLPDYRNDLYEIYEALSNMGDLIEMHRRIDEMTNPILNSCSEKLSKIKRVFREAIGDELARHYIICGEKTKVRKISIDKSLVKLECLKRMPSKTK